MKRIKDICPKCGKYKTCEVPCYPIERYLERDNKRPFERSNKDTTTVYPQHKQVIRSTFSRDNEKIEGRYPTLNDEARAFSTENGNPFSSFEPTLTITSVFLQRFFGGWKYKDIAAANNISHANARVTYRRAVDKLIGILLEMDHIKKMTPEERKSSSIARSDKSLRKKNEKQKSYMKSWRKKQGKK